MSINSIANDYKYCIDIASNHYENFPVASRFLPKKLRHPIAAIYTFAREADDIVDEGNDTPEIREKRLDTFTDAVQDIEQGRHSNRPNFRALQHTMQQFNLPYILLYDLLSAFRQDIHKTRYADFDEVLDYCRRSANPIGRLLLCLHQQNSAENEELSDNICTALQLINFLQDIDSDLKTRNRVYIPQDRITHYAITIDDIRNQKQCRQTYTLLDEQIDWAEERLERGAPLGKNLKGRFGLEIRLIISGGRAVIKKLRARKNIYARPTLNHWSKFSLLYHAMNFKLMPE